MGDTFTGKTKSGIEYTVDKSIREDSRFLHLLVKMNSKSTSNIDRADALFKLLGLMFGDDEGVYALETAIAETNGGKCSTELLISTLSEILEGIGAKN